MEEIPARLTLTVVTTAADEPAVKLTARAPTCACAPSPEVVSAIMVPAAGLDEASETLSEPDAGGGVVVPPPVQEARAVSTPSFAAARSAALAATTLANEKP